MAHSPWAGVISRLLSPISLGCRSLLRCSARSQRSPHSVFRSASSFHPHLSAPPNYQVLLTIGLTLMSMALTAFIFGTRPQVVKLPEVLEGTFQVFGRDFPSYRAFIVVIGLTVFCVLLLSFERTVFGARFARPSITAKWRKPPASQPNVVQIHLCAGLRPRCTRRRIGGEHRRPYPTFCRSISGRCPCRSWPRRPRHHRRQWSPRC